MRNTKNLIFALLFIPAVLLGCGSNESQDASTNDPTEVDADVISNNKGADNPEAKNNEPIITFKEKSWDFNQITEGEIVKHTFVFTNTGNEVLIVNSCTASCGCTTPKCNTDPVPPGESGEIEVRFDSNRRTGNQTKSITVIANTTPPETILNISGFVKKSETSQ
jgi:hypothetical protein